MLNKLVLLRRFTYFYLMGYVRITVLLRNGGKRSGVRAFAEPMNLEDIRRHALALSGEALGSGAIEGVVVKEVAADDPAVVAFIMRDRRSNNVVPRSDGEHPIAREMQRRPPR
jgi:hypothetical protein